MNNVLAAVELLFDFVVKIPLTPALPRGRGGRANRYLWAIAALLCLTLISCGQPEEPTAIAERAESTAVPATATAEPTATDEPAATATTAPTNTPEPAATETTAPTATAEPTNTPEPTATATAMPEPTPLVMLSREELEEDQRSIFTGLPIEDEEIAERRPIICKISNSPQEFVRPQSGLNSADIVYEHLAEGVTRFAALFQSQTPEEIGPVRSARLIDLELTRMYDATLCFSGASIGVSERLETSDIRGRLVRSYYDGYYRKDIDKPYEHTFFAVPELFWQKFDEIDAENASNPDIAELNRAPQPKSQIAFTSEAPADGIETDSFTIDYRKFYEVEWQWDDEQAQWLRWGGGTVYTDTNDSEQVAVSNVVILTAVHEIDESICDWQIEKGAEVSPACRAGGLYPELIGRGDVVILRDGMRYSGYWQRNQPGEMLTYFTDDDEPLPLQTGQTWVQMLPQYFDEPVTFYPSENE